MSEWFHMHACLLGLYGFGARSCLAERPYTGKLEALGTQAIL